ncbi:hypothetical protein [Campylobacter sp. CS_ED2]|uniref:hypothetical protein n=1 Tax=Campylobacter sp. CS_ED2 TaxID=2984141 RepID=UPI0022EA0F0A|nr:hypothetical protein [Campylobacter sp. CS_ED2]
MFDFKNSFRCLTGLPRPLRGLAMTENLKGLNLNNEKIMREKAEQMAKNAEMKIQKAQTKEAKYQQWLENKKQTDPNFRDYDENPLIIKSYEWFFVKTLFLGSLYFGGLFFWIFMSIFKGSDILGVRNEYLQFGLLLMACIIVIYIIYKLKHKDHTIKFTNKYIEFYDDGKLKRQHKIVYDDLVRPFFLAGKDIDAFSAFITIATICFGIFISLTIVGFILIVSIYFANFLIKLCFYIFLNRNLKGFKVFPFIRIAKFASYERPLPYNAFLSMKYFMIYLYNDEIYKEVKKYFLQKDIDIDRLSKTYIP